MFSDRYEAGRQLAKQFSDRTFHNPLVLAIPRGGVAVGSTLAHALKAELDVVLVAKLRVPLHPELALGAICENGDAYLDSETLDSFQVDEEYIHHERHYQAQKLAFRRVLFRTARPIADPRGRSVIITDDGIASGSTMLAALHFAQSQHPHEVIVAVPVASPSGLPPLRQWCDEVVCLMTPPMFFSIGQFYKDFSCVKDIEAVRLVRAAYQDQSSANVY
jgi:putative phosphoribosyl transferase